MNFIQILISLIILFVAINFASVIYHFINRKRREGLENDNIDISQSLQPSTDTSKALKDQITSRTKLTRDPLNPGKGVKAVTICPNGCKIHKNIDGDCGSLQKDANGNYFKECNYECDDTDKGYEPDNSCKYDQQCKGCGAFKVTGLWDSAGNYIGQAGSDSVDSSTSASLADGAQIADKLDKTLDDDTANAYNDAISTSSTPASTDSKCNVLKIHNRSKHAHNSSSYGKWFPAKLHSLNLTQREYEEAGRKFLNDESVKKGIQRMPILDSEAEVLGRLLWRVYMATITQKCDHNSQKSVKDTMNHELALMKKIYSIQSTLSPSSISKNAHRITSATCPKQARSKSTTGMMTNTIPIFNKMHRDPRINLPSSGTYTGYTNDYHIRNPNKKPRPYNSVWDIF